MERDIFLKAASGSETICLEVELGLMSHCSKSVVIFIFLQFRCFSWDFTI